MQPMSPRVQAAMSWFFDPVTREPRPRTMILMGLGILAIGVTALWISVDAVLAGQQFAGVQMRRSMSSRMPSDIAVVVSAFMTLAGAGLMTVALGKALPGLAERTWIKRAVAGVFALALLLLLLVGAAVVAARVLR